MRVCSVVQWGAVRCRKQEMTKNQLFHILTWYIFGKLITCALRICNCFWAWGSFQPLEHVLENGPEKWFFLLFSNYMFLESWDQAWNESVGIFRIRGYLRSWEVIKGQTLKITEPRHVICFWKPLEVSM